MSPFPIYQIIQETYNTLKKILQERKYTNQSIAQKRWREIADGFYKYWNFPSLVGTTDGKHIVIQTPCSGLVQDQP